MAATVIPPEPIGRPAGYPCPDLTPAEVRRRFLRLLGPFRRPSVPLNVRVTGEEPLAGDVIRQRLEYDVAPGERVPAYHLFRRDLGTAAPGVLAIHSHGGEPTFKIGKDAQAQPDARDPNQYAYRAALAGFRVLAPDALCFGERRAEWGYATFFMDEVNAHAEYCARGRSLAWKSVWDNSRALEVLKGLGAPRIGAIGHSGGSTQSYLLAAVNPAVAAAVCFYSFCTLRHQFYQYRLCHCLYHYLPGMVTAGIDWDQVVALIAPRPLFLGWGDRDEGTPEIMYRAFAEAVQRRCAAEGLPPSLTLHEEEDCGHCITEAMLTHAFAFLDQALR
jgi:dienelactone hydrolase